MALGPHGKERSRRGSRETSHYLRFLTLSINLDYIAIHAGSSKHLRHGHVFDNNKHKHIQAKIRRAVSVTNQQS
jgi:hypothetical protein